MQIGLIAGIGELPVIIAGDARSRGYRVITIALEGLASAELDAVSDVIVRINPGRFGAIIDALKQHGVSEAIMAGKVPKALLYKAKLIPDLRAVKFLFSLKDRTDDGILNAITTELAAEGIKIIDTAQFSAGLLTPEGCMTRNQPTKEEWKDIAFGWHIAKEIGRLDIGQTVVVKGKAVMAVEAIEGTDEAISRGGLWASGGAVVVKVSKPHQDMRLDVPVVGLDTLEAMIKAKARVLGIEAGRSIVIRRDDFVREAERADIAVVGLSVRIIDQQES